MKKETLSILISGITISSSVSASTEATEKEQRNNIILIITDQQTANAMSCVGNPNVKTPGMDGLAKDGILFPRAYVSYPLSGPSRASLITGCMPVQIGIQDNGGVIAEKHMEKSIGRVMSEAGYECLYAGKWHAPALVNLPAQGTGFTKVCDMDDTILVDECIPHLEKKRDKPLFLVVSFLNPHEICEYARFQYLPTGNVQEPDIEDCPQLPYNAPIPPYYPEAILLNRNADPRSYPTGNYTDDEWRRYLNAYYRLVERVDQEIVKLIDQVKKNNLYDTSLILFVSDHGDAVGVHRGNQKRVLQEDVIRVPFIVKAPQAKQNNKVNNEALINTSLDIYQTICDYAGIGENNELPGKSLKPILEGKTRKHHEEIYVETLLDSIETRGWTVVGKDYKYVIYRSFRNNEQLFDLTNDPYEMRNLAVDKTYKTILTEQRKKLYTWSLKTNDNLLQTLLRYADK